MDTTPPQPGLSRRDLFKLLAAAGVTAAGGYALFEYPPWLDYDQSASQIRTPVVQGGTAPAQLRELVRYATLAASGHNTQPWTFAISEHAIDIYPDYLRHLPVVDPGDRELWISLGCALENLLVAARAAGYAADVTYPDAADVIHIELTPDTPQAGALFAAIPRRQNTRSVYDGQPIPTADLSQVEAVSLEPGIVLHVMTSPGELATVLEYVNTGNLRQYADPAFVDELIAWLRFNKKEALASRDGLYAPGSGNPAVPRWLGQRVVAGTQPQQQADTDATKLRSSPGAVVIASESDSKTAWVRAGQVYERLALTLTSLNITSAFLNQPIEVADVRGQFQRAIGLGAALPQLLMRVGYAAALPQSLRRPVDQVLR